MIDGMVGAGYSMTDILELPVMAIGVLADAASARSKAELIRDINAHRISGADKKAYQDVIRSIERG